MVDTLHLQCLMEWGRHYSWLKVEIESVRHITCISLVAFEKHLAASSRLTRDMNWIADDRGSPECWSSTFLLNKGV